MKKLQKLTLSLLVMLVMTIAPGYVVNAAQDASDTKEGANVILADTTYTESISSSDDVDYYKIQAVDYTNYYQFTYVTDSSARNYLSYEIVSADGVRLANTSV